MLGAVSMTLKPNSFVPAPDDIVHALQGLSAADIVMLLRQSLELRGYDHAIAVAEALPEAMRREPSVRLCEAVARFVAGQHALAAKLVDEVVRDAPDHLVAREVHGEMLLRTGRRQEALEELSWVAERYPDYPGLQGVLSVLLMPGPHYRDVLAAIHQHLRPRTYLEIGVETGATLALATTAEVAVGVDPADYPVEHELAAGARIVRLESDTFFERHSRRELFGEHAVDFAFIDGMHLFEYALRDFVNCERWCDRASTIVLHDCLPISRIAAERERKTRFWVGDTWKAIVAIARNRPDVQIRTILAPPSGLVVMRKLDPRSKVLSERLDEIVASLSEDRYTWAPGAWPKEFNALPNTPAALAQALA
jgi:hypothetical protein